MGDSDGHAVFLSPSKGKSFIGLHARSKGPSEIKWLANAQHNGDVILIPKTELHILIDQRQADGRWYTERQTDLIDFRHDLTEVVEASESLQLSAIVMTTGAASKSLFQVAEFAAKRVGKVVLAETLLGPLAAVANAVTLGMMIYEIGVLANDYIDGISAAKRVLMRIGKDSLIAHSFELTGKRLTERFDFQERPGANGINLWQHDYDRIA